jgi:hypothetical protein
MLQFITLELTKELPEGHELNYEISRYVITIYPNLPPFDVGEFDALAISARRKG